MFRLRPFWCWLLTGHYWDETSVEFTPRGMTQKCHICGTSETNLQPHTAERAVRRFRTTNRGGAKTREDDV